MGKYPSGLYSDNERLRLMAMKMFLENEISRSVDHLEKMDEKETNGDFDEDWAYVRGQMDANAEALGLVIEAIMSAYDTRDGTRRDR